MNPTVTGADCWTRGGTLIVYQQCPGCARRWLFQRPFCPHCGRDDPEWRAAGGGGTVCASTLVHRAPDEHFRALAPYRLVLVDLDEGLRLMAHAALEVHLGQRAHGAVHTIAGRRLPYFVGAPEP